VNDSKFLPGLPDADPSGSLRKGSRRTRSISRPTLNWSRDQFRLGHPSWVRERLDGDGFAFLFDFGFGCDFKSFEAEENSGD